MKRELEYFKEANAFTIRVESDEKNRALRGTLTSADDPTETALDDVKDWDAVIYNNSAYDALKTAVENLIPKIQNKFADKF